MIDVEKEFDLESAPVIYPMFSYRDVKANSFSPPFVSVNASVARRDFDYRLHNDKSFGFAPSDYELFKIGYFCVDTGQVTNIMPEFIINGGELF